MQPHRGWDVCWRLPRVARSLATLAERFNPVGIGEWLGQDDRIPQPFGPGYHRAGFQPYRLRAGNGKAVPLFSSRFPGWYALP